MVQETDLYWNQEEACSVSAGDPVTLKFSRCPSVSQDERQDSNPRPLTATPLAFYRISFYINGARGGVVGWGTALQTGTSRVRFPMVSLELIPWHNRFGRTMAWGRLSLLGGKGGRCVGLTTLPPSCADCLQIWEPGPLRACPGL
jgi:hypothetical protein